MDHEQQARLLSELQGSAEIDRALVQRPDGPDGTASGRAAEINPTIDLQYLKFGEQLERLFELPSLDAPGMRLVGAQIDPAKLVPESKGMRASATGKALDIGAAVRSCISEAIEYVAQHACGDETLVSSVDGPPPGGVCSASEDAVLLECAGIDRDRRSEAIDWVPAKRLCDGGDAWLPAVLCYRGLSEAPAATPRVKLGSGCAAGPTKDWAELHALYELIERDAVALWWIGGQPPAAAAESVTQDRSIIGLLAIIREDRSERTTWLLDITTDLAIPCIVAASCTADGRGFACGFAARRDVIAAAKSAIMEMAQMEMAIHIVQLKRTQQGDGALGKEDKKILRRYFDIDVSANPSLRMQQATRREHALRADYSMTHAAELEFVVAQLAAHNLYAYGVDLFRDAIGVPAVRLVAPGLQPMPSSVVTPRLAATIAATGGGPGLNSGIKLI